MKNIPLKTARNQMPLKVYLTNSKRYKLNSQLMIKLIVSPKLSKQMIKINREEPHMTFIIKQLFKIEDIQLVTSNYYLIAKNSRNFL